MKQRHLVLAALLVLALHIPTARASDAKLDVAASIPIFQGLLANYNQELGRLDDVLGNLENGGAACADAKNAAVIVESYKKSMLLAGGVQDILTTYFFIDKGLADMNLYLWTRINHMRLQAFSYVTDAEKALEKFPKDGEGRPILGDGVEKIRLVYGKIRDMEDAFALLLGK